jgi:hypothetical protein
LCGAGGGDNEKGKKEKEGRGGKKKEKGKKKKEGRKEENKSFNGSTHSLTKFTVLLWTPQLRFTRTLIVLA